MRRSHRTAAWSQPAIVLACSLFSTAASAITFDLDYGGGIEGTLNTTVTLGAAIRTQDRHSRLVGKSNLNPDVCFTNDQGGNNQQCQGTVKDQVFPSLAGSNAPGQASINFDDGNLNYDKYDLTQAVAKITQDLSLTWGDYGLFAKWLYFYDAVNNDFEEFHPNRITPQNRDSVAIRDGRSSNATFQEVIAKGAPVTNQRADGETLKQIGTDLQLFDLYVYGYIPLGESEISVKLGRQTINWGESTVLLINSLNQVNPINVNNFTRVGFDLSELFIPTNMISLGFEPFYNATLSGFYSLEWEPVEAPAPGSYFSFLDVGFPNINDTLCICFGGGPESPFRTPDIIDPATGEVLQTGRLAAPLDNPLSGLTPTTTTMFRVPDNRARDDGQFGISFKYYAENFNNGTEFGLYYMRYHSQLPYISFYATDASCARREGNDLGMDATNGVELLLTCPDLPVVAAAQGRDPRTAESNAVPLDGVRFQFEYPEDIEMFGFSFNTTVGDWSIQGELAYRPDMPLQVDGEDLTFLALGPTLSRCHDPDVGCSGSNVALAPDVTGTEIPYTSSDFDPYPGMSAFPDTFDLSIGHAVGSARSFPSFIGAYRGIAAGEQVPTDRSLPLDSNNPGYIRGWEYFDVYQMNLGATYVQGATDNVIGADQVIWLFEVSGQMVPDLPGTEELQIETFGTFLHASAGADGSMTGNYQQDCANTLSCNFGADGLRFNPHQEDARGYPDKFSWGYAIVALIRYESVLPGISLQPIIIHQHDVQGSSVDVANQFVEGRRDTILLLETRYKEQLSFNTGYTWFTGGGKYNQWRDRDQALFYIKYQF